MIKNAIQKLNPAWALRLGLGIMYLYSGSDLFYHPSAWSWATPLWFSAALAPIMSVETYLRIQGVGEMAMGLLFFAWFSGAWGVRIASALAVLEMAGILLFIGIDPITFRDIGLLGGAIALLIMSFKDINHTS